MIAADGFFFATLIFLKLFGSLPCGAVDALKLGFVFVAAPVSSGHRFEFDRFWIEISGIFDMGTCAQIPPLIAQMIECNGFDQAVEDFEFVGFVLSADASFGVFAGDFFALDGKLAIDDFDHLFFNRLEIFIAKRIRCIKVIVEAIFNPRADRNLCLGKELLHGHGHDVGGGVANFLEVFGFAGFGKMNLYGV